MSTLSKVAVLLLVLCPASVEAGNLWDFKHSWSWPGGHHKFFFKHLPHAHPISDKFEEKFDELMAEYEFEVNNTPDYIGSDEYHELIDEMTCLAEKHGKLVSFKEHKIEHLEDLIDKLGEHEDKYQHWLDKLEEHTHLPDKVLHKIGKALDKLESIWEHKTEKLEDKLADKQACYDEALALQDEMQVFLNDIQNANNALTTFSSFSTEQEASPALFSSPTALSESTTLSGSSSASSSLSLNVVPSDLASVQIDAGFNVGDVLAGGLTEVGGVEVTFEDSSGGEFTSQYFQIGASDSLAESIGQTAFDDINFLLAGETAQGWELHFDGDFDGSVQVSLTYDESLLPEGFDESNLQIMHFVSELGIWEVPEDLVVDTENNLLLFSVTSFSPFVLSMSAVTAPEPAGFLLALMAAAGLFVARKAWTARTA